MNSNIHILPNPKPFVFYFSFMIGDDDEYNLAFTVNELGMTRLLNGEYKQRAEEFHASSPTDDRCSAFNIFANDYYDRYSADIESEFGIHDYGSSPCEEVDALGYYTSEIHLDDIYECMTRHRDVFVALAGADCVADIVEIDATAGSDFSIYNAVLAELAAK